MVTVRFPVPPCVTVALCGCRLAIVGGAALTATVALTDPSFTLAVIWALPMASAVTGIATVVWLMATGTLLGTVATPVSLLVTVSVPATVGAGESVAVKVPEEPTVRFKGLGIRAVGVGRIFVP